MSPFLEECGVRHREGKKSSQRSHLTRGFDKHTILKTGHFLVLIMDADLRMRIIDTSSYMFVLLQS